MYCLLPPRDKRKAKHDRHTTDMCLRKIMAKNLGEKRPTSRRRKENKENEKPIKTERCYGWWSLNSIVQSNPTERHKKIINLLRRTLMHCQLKWIVQRKNLHNKSGPHNQNNAHKWQRNKTTAQPWKRLWKLEQTARTSTIIERGGSIIERSGS